MAFDRITTDAAVMNGQPCIRNHRLTVRRVVELMATYSDRAELRRDYSELDDEDVRQALLFTAACMDGSFGTSGQAPQVWFDSHEVGAPVPSVHSWIPAGNWPLRTQIARRG